MISNCAKVITNWLENNGAISHEDYELYYYASYSLLITMLPMCLALVVGGIMGKPSNTLLVILPFMVIRKYSGGYHAKKAGVCMLFSVIILCVFTWISSRAVWNKWLILILLVSVLSLVFFSPMESVNKALSNTEKRRYKKITMCLLGGLLLLILALEGMGISKAATYISIGVILSASLQVPCLVENIVKNTKTRPKSSFYADDVDCIFLQDKIKSNDIRYN